LEIKDIFRDNIFFITLTISILLLFSIFFGAEGLRLVLGLLIFIFLPPYIVITCFEFDQIEKIIFSFFIGLGLFPTFVFYIAIPLSSMKLSILVSFILLLSFALIFSRKYKIYKEKKAKKKEKKSSLPNDNHIL
jgi:uncharacterized membrane protein